MAYETACELGALHFSLPIVSWWCILCTETGKCSFFS